MADTFLSPLSIELCRLQPTLATMQPTGTAFSVFAYQCHWLQRSVDAIVGDGRFPPARKTTHHSSDWSCAGQAVGVGTQRIQRSSGTRATRA